MPASQALNRNKFHAPYVGNVPARYNRAGSRSFRVPVSARYSTSTNTRGLNQVRRLLVQNMSKARLSSKSAAEKKPQILSHPGLRAQTSERSAHGSEAFLGFCFRHSRWLRRQLKNRCLLTATQLCQENNAPIRKFERIMVRPLLVLIYLSEDCGRVS